jgi:hypothetical protein
MAVLGLSHLRFSSRLTGRSGGKSGRSKLPGLIMGVAHADITIFKNETHELSIYGFANASPVRSSCRKCCTGH